VYSLIHSSSLIPKVIGIFFTVLIVYLYRRIGFRQWRLKPSDEADTNKTMAAGMDLPIPKRLQEENWYIRPVSLMKADEEALRCQSHSNMFA